MLLQLAFMTLAAVQEVPPTQPTEVDVEAATQTGKQEKEELICRRRMAPDARMEGRMKPTKICKTKEGWKAFARRSK